MTTGRSNLPAKHVIDHTPQDETVRIYTGNAFDLTGERRRTSYIDRDGKEFSATESFEIKIRNHKKEPMDVHVVEHLYRGTNWDIVSNSADYQKKDSHTIDFPVTIPPDGEKVITYTAHYSW